MNGDETWGLMDVEAAERVLRLAFTPEQRGALKARLEEHVSNVEAMRAVALSSETLPAATFDPHVAGALLPEGESIDASDETLSDPWGRDVTSIEEATFASVAGLAAAYRRGVLRPSDVTEAFLRRIADCDGAVQAIVTPLAERARAHARAADEVFERGEPAHALTGIPYLAKDLLAVPDAPTTWGAGVRESVVETGTAEVAVRLDAAGAILLAKASLGELAMGDVWFGGQTRNPWNLEEGSSGSSAGSAAGVAAGFATLAVGSETMGSILSPSTRCGVVGLRPTFGRVSRHGAMPLAWSLDKLGSMGRSVSDVAVMLEVMAGRDDRDPATRDVAFPWRTAVQQDAEAARLRVGIPEDLLADPGREVQAFLEAWGDVGAEVRPVTLPDLPGRVVMTLLMVEAASVFDRWVRGGEMDSLVQQGEQAWPNQLRAARFVSGVDYAQAQRVQRLMRDAIDALFDEVDVIVTPSLHEHAMLLGNAAGVPAVTLPVERSEAGRPGGSVSILARAFHEHRAVAVAAAVERRLVPLGVPASCPL